MKLSEWARAKGVSRQSATRWFHAGVLPVPAHQLATGTILVYEACHPTPCVAIYARVSSADQRADLDRQVARLTVVVEEAEVADDLVLDMVEVLTSFCARLYGRRSARPRAEAAVVATQGQAVA